MNIKIIIYKVTNIGNNPENGKSYIGYTKQKLKDRKSQHFSSNKQEIFHVALKQWGYDSFSWKILAIVEKSMKYIIERKSIKVYNTLAPNGYNSTAGGEGGYELSEEIRTKIGKIHKGKKLSKEHIKKIVEANKGRIVSEETKRKMSEASKGKPKSEEHTRNKSGEKHSMNKYHYYCSDGKDYWKDFTKSQKSTISHKFIRKNSNKVIYHNILITRELK